MEQVSGLPTVVKRRRLDVITTEVVVFPLTGTKQKRF